MKPCPETFPYPLIVLDETDSTNRYISQLCNNPQKAVAELTTVSAEFQTAGKGQRGNSWEAEKEKNLLFSFVLYPTFLEARCQFILSQIISLSIKEELDRWSDEITIKWPNDIYWRDKKICGILIENDLSGHFIGRCISGVGININQKEFHSDAPNPVSLKQITGKEHNRHEILAHILKRVQIYYNGLQTEERNTYAAEISARYARALFRAGDSIFTKMPTASFPPACYAWNKTDVLFWKTRTGKKGSIYLKRCNIYFKSRKPDELK